MITLGYAQSIITPSLSRPVYLAGFSQNRRAQSVNDDLYVRALALRDGENLLVLAALDLIGFFQSDAAAVIKQVKIIYPHAQVILASTHTHHGPDTIGLWGSAPWKRGVDPHYLKALRDTLCATLLSACSQAETAAPDQKAAAIHVPGVAKNARDPHIIDDELTCLQFLGVDNEPLATLVNFPCHPEVLGRHNPVITSDYPAALRSRVEEVTRAPCLFFPGSLGGMMTPDVPAHSFEQAEIMGNVLGDKALEALTQAKTEPAGPIARRQEQIRVLVTNPLFKLAFFLHLLPDVRDSQGFVTSEVNFLRIGSAWFAAVPGELLPRLGLSLKKDLAAAGAKAAGILGLANDELGYILPEEDFIFPNNPFRPGDHYEETMSISSQIGPQVVQAVRGLLQDDSFTNPGDTDA